MDITYDILTRELVIDTSRPKPSGEAIRACLNRHGQTVSFNGLSFGLEVTADGEAIQRAVFPPDGVVWVQTDQDVMASVPVRWAPDQVVGIRAWFENAGRRVEANTTFVVPRPAVPAGNGWVWRGRWQLSVNEADASTLALWLDGVGPVLAQQIIDGRPWASVQDLETIPGISETMLADWDGLITV